MRCTDNYNSTQRDFPLGFGDRTLSRQCTSVRRERGMYDIAASYVYTLRGYESVRVRRRSSAVDCRSVGHLKNRSSG